MKRLAPILGLFVYGALLLASSPRWPDDWDGIGFLASVRDFDLAHFHPHPPGYPVYVALLRLAALVASEPVRAAALVAALGGMTTVALAFDATRRSSSPRAALGVAAVVALAPLTWRACSGVGSEAPALTCLAACGWGLVAIAGSLRTGPFVLGLAAGVGLGVRLSWAPLYVVALALAPRAARSRAWTVAGLAVLSWVAPLLAIVGPGRLVELYAIHFAGHAERWGGTVVTDPGWRRLGWLARDLFVDGLGAGLDAPGILVGAALVACGVQGVRQWRRIGWQGWRVALLAGVPYLAWVALGQNLRDQPRHVLPLVALLAVGLALPAGTRRGWFAVTVLGATLAVRTGLDAWARRTVPPPGQQLVELARAQPSPGRLAVFGAASVRFFEGTELAPDAMTAGTLGDAQLALTRLDALPERVWITGEVLGRDVSRWPLVPVAKLCRPERLDRRAPCLAVYEWRLPFLR